MSNFEIQWKALKERKDDDPEVPKMQLKGQQVTEEIGCGK